MKTKVVLALLCMAVIVVNCRKDPALEPTSASGPVLPAVPYDYVGDVAGIPQWMLSAPLNFLNTEPSSNPVTNWGVTLGRVLFYDKNLSANNTVACGSCHHQDHAFADTGAVSTGFQGGHTSRSSMAIVNLRFSRTFFWDLRANGLEQQSIMPILNALEMGMDSVSLVNKVTALSYYPGLFEKAFGTPDVTLQRIQFAIAQFLRAMVSYRSKYDEGVVNGFVNFTPLENDGMNLFFSGTFSCNHCHSTQNFYERDARNNGLDSVHTDIGRAEITGDPNDIGKFRVPTLRNIALTAPYMHDGRLRTLEEVVEHYNSGILPSPTLDDRITVNQTTGGPPVQMNMTAYEKTALVAFMHTLTDQTFITDPKFSDPFQR
ncbi:MAG TPA: cytochrome c peroxidase [Bacteroidia bacterium]|nr:cytochrome c peroxidase [Bacteroidia bacterium]